MDTMKRVKIKSLSELREIGIEDDDGDIELEHAFFIKGMFHLAEKIISINEDMVHCDDNGYHWLISDEMIDDRDVITILPFNSKFKLLEDINE